MPTGFISGASRGFGAHIARRALAAGDADVATARNPDRITAQFGEHPNLLAVRLDVTREEDAREAVARAVERFGRIDILVNNAGFGLLGAVEEASAEEVETLYATNVFGLLKVTRAVLPQMRAQRSGHVINLSSVGGYVGFHGFGVYCSTKFAVEGLSEALATELAPLGVHVTVVEPGFFRTDFLDSTSLMVSPTIIGDYAETGGAMREFAGDINHRQPGDPEKLADGILLLADMDNPPVRLPFGSDTLAAIEEKNAQVADALATWRDLAASTDIVADAA